ncbi:MAG TPA: GTP-binding protein [Gemmataceae bacterium]|nr:GTP-binding protein [Gemmataceae bacterium]
MLEALIERYRQGDRLALTRLLTLAAQGKHLDELWKAAEAGAKKSLTVALTGSGGVGKSTLVGRLIPFLRQQDQTVAILACDPQSPVSGGALLGDRFRMPSRPEDDGVFIRSLAAPGGEGAVARHLDLMCRLLASFGFDVVLIETVGAGQGETTVRRLVDVVVLLLQPETGDDLQWEKAGILEVADVIVIHKADLPGAEQLEAQVRRELGRPAPVVRVSAKAGTGLDELWKAVSACAAQKPVTAAPVPLLQLAQHRLAATFEQAQLDPRVQHLLAAYRAGSIGAEPAAEELLSLLTADRR